MSETTGEITFNSLIILEARKILSDGNSLVLALGLKNLIFLGVPETERHNIVE